MKKRNFLVQRSFYAIYFLPKQTINEKKNWKGKFLLENLFLFVSDQSIHRPKKIVLVLFLLLFFSRNFRPPTARLHICRKYNIFATTFETVYQAIIYFSLSFTSNYPTFFVHPQCYKIYQFIIIILGRIENFQHTLVKLATDC